MRNDVDERRLKNTLFFTTETNVYYESRVLLRDGFVDERVTVGNYMEHANRNDSCQRR